VGLVLSFRALPPFVAWEDGRGGARDGRNCGAEVVGEVGLDDDREWRNNNDACLRLSIDFSIMSITCKRQGKLKRT